MTAGAWTKEAPTESGWYWIATDIGEPLPWPEIVHVYRDSDYDMGGDELKVDCSGMSKARKLTEVGWLWGPRVERPPLAIEDLP